MVGGLAKDHARLKADFPKLDQGELADPDPSHGGSEVKGGTEGAPGEEGRCESDGEVL